MQRTASIISAAALFSAAGAATAGAEPCLGLEPVIIYTEIPGHPTAASPGLGIDFTGFLNLHVSPDGLHWIFKAFIDDPENDVIVVGTNGVGAIMAREADPTPIAGTTHSFLDSDCGINNAGMFAYGSRLDGATSLTDEVIFRDNGATHVAVVRESDAAPGLFDPTGAGDEVYGNSLNSVHVLDGGIVGYKADLLENIDNDYESALYHGAIVKSQEGTNTAEGEVIDSYVGLSGNTFASSPDGSTWIVEADILPGLGSDEAVLVNNEVMIRDGDALPGGPLVIDAVFGVDVDDQGNWFARGDFTDDTDWVVRNDAVLAMTGMPITAGSAETWGDSILAMNGLGDNYVLAGSTSNPDPDADSVLVLNGMAVIAREGDLIQLDATTQVAINSFGVEDAALTVDGGVLAFVTLRDPDTGAALGDAFIEWLPVFGCNPADVAAPCGVLDLNDINLFIAGFLAQDDLADLAAPFGVWDLQDLQAFISAFVSGCP